MLQNTGQQVTLYYEYILSTPKTRFSASGCQTTIVH